MGHSVLSWVCVCALGVMPLVGCSETAGDGGNGGSGGTECEVPADCPGDLCTEPGNEDCVGGLCTYEAIVCADDFNECTTDGGCADGECIATPVADGTTCGDGAGTCQAGSCSGEFACTEEGIREAIALGGGPHTFDCDGPTTVMVAQGFAMERDVELDGGGVLTLEGETFLVVFSVSVAAVTLRGFKVLRGGSTNDKIGAGAIQNFGKLTLVDSTVSESGWFAILNLGELVLERTSIVDNPHAFGILGGGGGSTTSIDSSTVANNNGLDIVYSSGLSISNSTIGGLTAAGSTEIVNSTIGSLSGRGEDVVVRGSVVRSCPPDRGGRPPRFVTSEGHNIEVSSDSCGFDHGTDQVDVTEGELNLGPLQDNGGPTMTHALGAGSVAIDQIPATACEVTEDQRGFARDSMCDVGAFEVQP